MVQAILIETSVSGGAAGLLKKVRIETFIFLPIFPFLFSPKMDNIFLPTPPPPQKKNCGLPTGFNNGHPLDRKQVFFRVASAIIWLFFHSRPVRTIGPPSLQGVIPTFIFVAGTTGIRTQQPQSQQ